MTGPFSDGLLPVDLDVDALRKSDNNAAADTVAASPKKETPNTEATPNADQLQLLRCLQDRSLPKTDCFGGVLFSREDSAGNPIFTFAVEGMEDSELQQALHDYNKLFRSGIRSLIYMADSFVETVDNASTGKRYTAFNFIRKDTLISLRDFSTAHPNHIFSGNLMAALFDLIVEDYHNNTPYRCLNCISPDTVFVENAYRKEDKEELRIYLLPLRSFRNCFPLEIAPEAHTPGALCNESSDLHAAAYVSIEVIYNFDPRKAFTLEDGHILTRCLSSVPQLRPTLREVYHTLYDTTEEAPAPAPKPHSAPSPDKSTDSIIHAKADGVAQWLKKVGEKVMDYFVTEPENQRTGTTDPHENNIRAPKVPLRKHHIQPIADTTEEDDNR